MLDAAWALFLERGVETVPIETIAAKAGVSKGTLYAAYADKGALFEAAVLREMERIEAAQGVGTAMEAPACRDAACFRHRHHIIPGERAGNRVL